MRVYGNFFLVVIATQKQRGKVVSNLKAIMASGEVCASALNEFSLYSPGDQAALQAVVEDYFTYMDENESECLADLEGIFKALCVCVCIKVNY